ncbi:hypothetical protein D3C80_1637720 [compost metagenome]
MCMYGIRMLLLTLRSELLPLTSHPAPIVYSAANCRNDLGMRVQLPQLLLRLHKLFRLQLVCLVQQQQRSAANLLLHQLEGTPLAVAASL